MYVAIGASKFKCISGFISYECTIGYAKSYLFLLITVLRVNVVGLNI